MCRTMLVEPATQARRSTPDAGSRDIKGNVTHPPVFPLPHSSECSPSKESDA